MAPRPSVLTRPSGYRTRQTQVPVIWARAEFLPDTFAEQDDGTARVRLVISTGAKVRRQRFFEEPFDEILSFDEGAHRDERLDSGRAPLLDTHQRGSVREDVVGAIANPTWDRAARTVAVDARISGREDLAGLRQDVAAGIVTNVSIGYRVHRFRDITEAEDEVQQLLAIDWEIMEASLVPIGADAGASTRDAEDTLNTRGESLGLNACEIWEPDEMDDTTRDAILAFLRSVGIGEDDDFARTILDEADMTTLRAAELIFEEVASRRAAQPEPIPTPEPAPVPRVPQLPQPVDVAAEVQRAVAAERTRASTIRSRLTGAGLSTEDEFASRMLDDPSVTVERASGLILDALAEREQDDVILSHARVDVGTEGGERMTRGIEDAFLHRFSGLEGLDAETPAAGRERIQGNPFLHRTLVEVGRDYIERVFGVSTRHMSKMQAASAILQPRLDLDARGLHSTSDFPGILANIATKTLRRAFDLQEETYSPWTTRGTLPDFKQAQRVQVGNAPPLKVVREGAEYEYATFGEQSEPILLATYGRIVAMTRQMMINDDLDAFMRMPRQFGGSARQLISDLVYAHVTGNTVMADGVALYSIATHANLITAGGNALTGANGVTALSNTRQLGRRQRTIDPGDGEDAGHLMSVNLPHFRVPEQLETVAQQLTTTIQSQQVGNVNPFQGSFRTVAAEPRLGADSAATFYLMADPSLIDTIEVAFLQGEDGPTTEQRLGFNTDSLEVKVRMDVGTSPIDFRGMYRNDGAT